MTTLNANKVYAVEPIESYFQHESWFELGNIIKVGKNGQIKGKKIINSYGRVREIWEDGTYTDIYDGKAVSKQ